MDSWAAVDFDDGASVSMRSPLAFRFVTTGRMDVPLARAAGLKEPIPEQIPEVSVRSPWVGMTRGDVDIRLRKILERLPNAKITYRAAERHSKAPPYVRTATVHDPMTADVIRSAFAVLSDVREGRLLTRAAFEISLPDTRLLCTPSGLVAEVYPDFELRLERYSSHATRHVWVAEAFVGALADAVGVTTNERLTRILCGLDRGSPVP